MNTPRIMLAALLAIGSGGAPHVTQAQQPGIKRTDLLREDLGVPGREVIQVRVDCAPGAAFGMHSHAGAEVAYVLAGTLEYQFEGKPPVTLKMNQALFIPAGTVHAAKNAGTSNAAELATYVVEKGKPLVVPAGRDLPVRGVRCGRPSPVPHADRVLARHAGREVSSRSRCACLSAERVAAARFLSPTTIDSRR